MATVKKNRTRERGRTIDLPAWWLALVREQVAGLGKSYGEIGELLAAEVRRDEAWSHASVSRFLSGYVTDDMADAFVRFLGVPPAVFVARSEDEARAMLELQKTPAGRSRPEARSVGRRSSERSTDDQSLPVAVALSDEFSTSTERERLTNLENDLRRLQALVAQLGADPARQTVPVEPPEDVHAFRSPGSRRAKTDDGGTAS
jgi:hypothetical protein